MGLGLLDRIAERREARRTKERERVDDQRRRDEEAQAAKDEERKRLDRLTRVGYEFDGRTRFLVWNRPNLDDFDLKDESPRAVTGPELVAIHCAICRYETEPVKPVWRSAEGANLHAVWELNEDRTAKRKLRGAFPTGNREFLRVYPRRETCAEFCDRCGYASDGGNFCPSCGSETKAADGYKLTRCR